MARAYSVDLRKRVVSAVLEGGSVRAVASRFGVSASAAVKWSQRFRETGGLAPLPVGGRKAYVLIGEREWLLARIAETPDLTLRALQAELAARGVVASYHAVWDFFAHEGVTFKKKPARRRAGSAGRRPQTGPLEAPSGQA
jgi:putative transposase